MPFLEKDSTLSFMKFRTFPSNIFGKLTLLREVFLFLCYVYIILGAATMEDTDLNRIINKLKLSTEGTTTREIKQGNLSFILRF